MVKKEDSGSRKSLEVLANVQPSHSTRGFIVPLWCVHVIGPDDVIAMKDYKTALFHADDINRAMYARRGGKPRHEYDPVIIAYPMEWPWSAEQHAAALTEAR